MKPSTHCKPEQKESQHIQDPLNLPSDIHSSLAVEYSTHTPDKEGLEFEPAVSVAKTALGPLYVPLTSHTKRVEKNECIPEDWTGVDIGPESIRTFCSALELTRTLLWNGELYHMVFTLSHSYLFCHILLVVLTPRASGDV